MEIIENELRQELTDSLIGLYSLNIVPLFAAFLEGEQAVLLTLRQLNADVPAEIGRLTGIANNRMSAIVRSLNAKGLIKISQDAADKRKTHLTLTPAGEKVILAKEAEAIAYFDRFIETVGESEVKELIRIINLAIQKLGVQKT